MTAKNTNEILRKIRKSERFQIAHQLVRAGLVGLGLAYLIRWVIG